MVIRAYDQVVTRCVNCEASDEYPIDRIPAALKHGAYSATAVLPGESQAEFEKLHRGLIAELVPSGVLEDDIVLTIARLVWRKQNLTTLRIAEHAQSRRITIWNEKIRDNEPSYLDENGEPVNTREEARQVKRAAESEAQEELGENYEFVKLVKPRHLTASQAKYRSKNVWMLLGLPVQTIADGEGR